MSSSMQQQGWKLVLAARASSTPPSELEVLLRNYCHRVKVVEKLHGAHLLIPMTFPSKNDEAPVSKSLAVRFYSAVDITRLSSPPLCSNHEDNASSEEMDGLAKFASSFALSLVFFVLPNRTSTSGSDDKNIRVDELENNDSWTRRAMHTLTKTTTFSKNSDNVCCCRVIVVPDAAAALEGIRSFATALQPEKENLKKAFFSRQKLQHCIPVASLKHPTNNNGGGTASAENDKLRAKYASNHTRQVFANWARRFELPVGEEDVLMEMLGSLQDIAVMKDPNLPIEERTQEIIQSFFDCPEAVASSTCNDHVIKKLIAEEMDSQADQKIEPDPSLQLQHMGYNETKWSSINIEMAGQGDPSYHTLRGEMIGQNHAPYQTQVASNESYSDEVYLMNNPGLVYPEPQNFAFRNLGEYRQSMQIPDQYCQPHIASHNTMVAFPPQSQQAVARNQSALEPVFLVNAPAFGGIAQHRASFPHWTQPRREQQATQLQPFRVQYGPRVPMGMPHQPRIVVPGVARQQDMRNSFPPGYNNFPSESVVCNGHPQSHTVSNLRHWM